MNFGWIVWIGAILYFLYMLYGRFALLIEDKTGQNRHHNWWTPNPEYYDKYGNIKKN
jgi:hypothetical protein